MTSVLSNGASGAPNARAATRPSAHLAIALLAAWSALCAARPAAGLAPPAVTYLRAYRAPFAVPARMAVDAAGNVYVVDTRRGEVVVRAPNGRLVTRMAGLGRPVSVAAGSAGRIYVGDADSGSVTALDRDGNRLFPLGQGPGEFQLPNDVAVDAATGTVYVVDSPAHLVKRYSAAGAPRGSFGGGGAGTGQFDFPVGIAVDAAARRVLVADQRNYRVQVFDPAGAFQFAFGSQGSEPGQFNMPHGVSVDRQGRVYVADAVEGRIQVFDRDGDLLGYVGDFGEGAGQLRIPVGMVVDPFNRLFVAAANNARVEMFGLDTFADPETICPATLRVEPNPIERVHPASVVVGYVEVPGYRLDQVVPGSIEANGVAAAATPLAVGDHDGNGVPDLRVELDRSALLATLPADGAGRIAIAGTIGSLRFEGDAAVQVTTCGPGTTCPLGDADPQCNDAVCSAPAGCTIRPKDEGGDCEDGNACTVGDVCRSGVCVGASLACADGNACTDDTCDPVSGCLSMNNAAPCDDGDACTAGDTCADGVCGGAPLACADGNPCTDDGCDPLNGCVYANNTAPCDDGNACTAGDTCADGVCGGAPLACADGNPCTDDACIPARGCVYAANTAPCNDGDAGTVGDACDGTGRCRGQSAAGNYALLSWTPGTRRRPSVSVAARGLVRGDVCSAHVTVGAFGEIEGHVVAWASDGRAMALQPESRIAGNVVTGGGNVEGLDQAIVGGRIDQDGVAAELTQCLAARDRARRRAADFAALAPTGGFALGAIKLGGGATRRIPRQGALRAGENVVDLTDLWLGPSSTLTLVGTVPTDMVIVRVRGRMMLGPGARIETDGVVPERVLFVVDGSVALQPGANLTGTVFATGTVRVGRAAAVTGALLASVVELAPDASVDIHPFAGW